MQTFGVSDVVANRQALRAAAIEQALLIRIATAFGDDSADGAAPGQPKQPTPRIEAWRLNLDHLVAPPRMARAHPLIAAVHTAFAEHYPLALSPDDLWLCIAQAFARHVDGNAEALRGRFVRTKERPNLVVRRDDFVKGSSANDWASCFAEWSDAIAAHIGKQRDLVVASFTTTGPVERAASELVLMSAMKNYFDFTLMTMCGIPEITLLGSVEDWRAVRRRAEVLAEYGLTDWMKSLLPVLDQFTAAAAGRVDRAFWRSIYKLSDQSGGPYVTGWINVLFPYLDNPRPTFRTAAPPGLVHNRHAATWQDDVADVDDEDDAARAFGGTTMTSFPDGLSHVPVTWSYLNTDIAMKLSAGFLGVSQDPQSLAVRPVIGWTVAHDQS
jgi:hypothetical protein